MTINNDLMSPEEFLPIDKNFVNSIRIKQEVALEVYDLDGFFEITSNTDTESDYIIGVEDFVLESGDILQENNFSILLQSGDKLLFESKRYLQTEIASNEEDGIKTIININ